MKRQIFIDTIGWGFGLWFFGYILGIAFFPFVPNHLLGWIIMPIGTVAALVVLGGMREKKLHYYGRIAFSWTAIAIVFDYVLLVRLFNVTSYYKPDIFVYYAITFLLPLLVGLKRSS